VFASTTSVFAMISYPAFLPTFSTSTKQAHETIRLNSIRDRKTAIRKMAIFVLTFIFTTFLHSRPPYIYTNQNQKRYILLEVGIFKKNEFTEVRWNPKTFKCSRRPWKSSGRIQLPHLIN